MRSRRKLVLAFVASLVLLAADPALAAPFTPTTGFALSNRNVNANPTLTLNVKQEAGEEELDRVVLVLPAGFKIPLDAAIDDGETLGAGQIKIAAEPLCTTASQATVDADIIERDRTQVEKDAGFKAIWVVDIRPVATIAIKWKGGPAIGWRGFGDIPKNDQTCPPFQFRAVIRKTSSETNTKILRNPADPGTYTLKAMWTGVDGSRKTNQKSIQITS